MRKRFKVFFDVQPFGVLGWLCVFLFAVVAVGSLQGKTLSLSMPVWVAWLYLACFAVLLVTCSARAARGR